MRFSHLFVLLTQALATPTPRSNVLSQVVSKRDVGKLPKNFILANFGDSYSAGIGAGTFWQGQSPDAGRNNKCARMAGSVPAVLGDTYKDNMEEQLFMSCSGDVMKDLDNQVKLMLGTRPQVATLSISGNDFNFGNVVLFMDGRLLLTILEKNCVYAKRQWLDTEAAAQGRCDQEIQKSQNAINDNSKWAEYESKLHLILDALDDQGGLLYITNYAKFFATDMSDTDACAQATFFKTGWVNSLYGILKMNKNNRQTINNLVQQVNQKMSASIDNVKNGLPASREIVPIDIDPLFEGHRFCEPNNDPWGSDDDRVFFYDLSSTLEANSGWDGLTGDDLWAPEPPEKDSDGLVRPSWDNFQQASVFHPKKAAYLQILSAIQNNLGGRFSDVDPNPSGTNIHVNKGCIVINDSIRCQDGDAYNVAHGRWPTSKATFYAKFPGDNTVDYMVTPGCELHADIPANYGDMYFGEDNCLYDSGGNKVLDQCCQNQGTTQVLNPYFDHLFGPRVPCGPGTDSDSLAQAVGQQCVRIWADHNAGGGGWVAQFKPQSPNNCDGTCWPWPAGYGGIEAIGDGTYGTNCATYSDLNCQNQIGSTGNAVEHHPAVLKDSEGLGHSVKCFFHC
ncbi:SGNH hydrolase-type esterase domain-containing protein [Mariannaea sp. PMI_226]|nr:SGNH hydrolase-type esterase domain-containing protein [Mariannaea sp. PMI_226]